MSALTEQLRHQFDVGFAEPFPERAVELVPLLLIRAGGRAYAMRVSELGGVVLLPRLTPVPTSERALLGVAGIRGAAAPVFDLALLLGEPLPVGAPRLVALSAGPEPLAFAFGELDGQARVHPSEVVHLHSADHWWSEGIFSSGASARPVLRLPALTERARQSQRKGIEHG